MKPKKASIATQDQKYQPPDRAEPSEVKMTRMDIPIGKCGIGYH